MATAVMAVGGMEASALADSPTGAPQERAATNGNVANGGRWVALPPDRADGLGSARLPTMPAPVVIVRSESVGGFDWLDASIGAAVAMACVLVIAAARLTRADRPLPE